jgi:serine/threonine protein kinase
MNRYEILEYMGRGAFGQVAKCRELGSNTLVAIKITKRDPFFHQQSLREIKFLKMVII